MVWALKKKKKKNSFILLRSVSHSNQDNKQQLENADKINETKSTCVLVCVCVYEWSFEYFFKNRNLFLLNCIIILFDYFVFEQNR